MKLAKRRSLHSHVVHVVDLDNSDQPVCGQTSPWTIDPEWIDRLSIGCPGCRTFVVDWLLGRGVSRDARQLVRDDVEWRHQQVVTRPRGWGKGRPPGCQRGDPECQQTDCGCSR